MKAITAEEKKKLSQGRKTKKNDQQVRVSAAELARGYSNKTMELALLGVLTAIVFILAFTPIGYIKLPALSITFMTIPVIIAAILTDPKGGAIIGGMFGVTSLIQAITGASVLTNTLFQLNPVFTVILCLVPRILEGFLGGLIFKGLQNVDKTKIVSYAVTSLSVPLMNTLFFMSTLFLLFYQSDAIKAIAEKSKAFDPFTLFVAMAGINAVIEAVVCFIVGTAIAKALAVALGKIKK